MEELLKTKEFYKYKSEKEKLEKNIMNLITEEFEEHFRNTVADKNNIEKFKLLIKKRLEQYRQINKIEQAGIFQHDCSECLYLGDFIKTSFDEKHGILNVAYFDLYAHPRENVIEFIARYGDKLDEYSSFTYFIEGDWETQKAFMKMNDEIYEAFNRYGDRCRPNPPKWYPFPEEIQL